MADDNCVVGHRAFIYDRGGTDRIAEIVDLSMVRWHRQRDVVTEAEILIEGASCERQRDVLEAIEPKRHEMAIYRGNDRVWEGPVERIPRARSTATVYAHDVVEYLFGTIMENGYNNRYPNVVPVTTRMNTIITAELNAQWESLEDPINVVPYLDIRHFIGEAETSARTLAKTLTVGEHLDNFARSGGIDYVAVGRRIIIWDVSNPITTLQRLTEADFLGDAVVTSYGSQYASAMYSVGQKGRVGQAFAPLKYRQYYGPWARVVNNDVEEGDTAPSQADLNSQAKRNLNGRYPVPVQLRIPENSSLLLSDTLSVQDLVPGVYIPVVATLNGKTVQQTLKLHKLTVEETGEGERVLITLIPTTDPDEEPE